jgi:integrase
MSVFKLKDTKGRKLPWRGVVQRVGNKRLTKQFPTRQEAELWEQEHKKRERLRDVPEYQRMVELKELGQHTVRDVVEFYIASNPHLSRNNLITLNAFLRDDICEKNLLQLTKQDVNWFIEKKKTETWKSPGSKRGEAKPLSPRTVRRLLNILQRVFQWTIEFRGGFENLPNHFRGIRIQGSTGGRRERSLEDGELERILEACKSCHEPNRYFVPLAIHLAIDTGLRRQEIFNLMWSDIDDENRRIRIRKSKTDKGTGNVGATIVLPAKAKSLLITLMMSLIKIGHEVLPEKQWREICMSDGDDFKNLWPFPSDLDERIFPMSGKAFSQAWGDVLRRAAIPDLHFHDLRRTANTRFIHAGLTVEERNIMLRHSDKSMQAVYIGRNHLLKGIQDKLDRFVLNGLTMTEAEEKGMVMDFGEMTIPIQLRA